MADVTADWVRPGPPVRVLADLVGTGLIRTAALVLGGAALVGAAAQLAVPIPGSPVPITGQTFAVLLVGAALGWARGAASMLVYLLAGVVGVPWFAAGGSGTHLPTLGYVVGFVLVAALVGRLATAGFDRSGWRTVVMMAAGTAVIYAVGVPWLALALHIDLVAAARVGLVPFLIGDAVKVALAAGLLPGAWRLLGPADRPPVS